MRANGTNKPCTILSFTNKAQVLKACTVFSFITRHYDVSLSGTPIDAIAVHYTGQRHRGVEASYLIASNIYTSNIINTIVPQCIYVRSLVDRFYTYQTLVVNKLIFINILELIQTHLHVRPIKVSMYLWSEL